MTRGARHCGARAAAPWGGMPQAWPALTSIKVGTAPGWSLRAMCRLLVTVVLLLAAALSGPVDAAVRAAGPGRQVVLCADGAALTVTLAGDGQPADRDHHARHCPDCLPLPLNATGPADLSMPARPLVVTATAARPSALPRRAHRLAVLPSPRGPPGGEIR